MIDVEIVTDGARLEALAPAWRRLLDRAGAASVFMTPTWLCAWWRQFGESDARQLRLVLFRDAAGELVGLAPLSLRIVRHRGVLPVRRIELLATGEPRAEEICSDYVAVLTVAEHAETIATRLAVLLVAGDLGGWDTLLMPAMRGDDPFVALFAAALRSRGRPVEVAAFGSCLTIPLPKSFADYLKALGSKHRYLVTRALRDLEAWAGKEPLELRRAATPPELAEGRRILHALHAERWSARDHRGVFAAARFTAFHDEIMPRLLACEDGRLDLLWIVAGGKEIAVLYNVVYRGRVHFYQSGRSLDVPEKLKPGIAIHALAIRRAIEEGLAEYDFLSGPSQYKRQLALGAHEQVVLSAVGPGVRARVVEVTRRRGDELARRARATVKRILS